MSVSAATHSQILAMAPAPKRLAYGQADPDNSEAKAALKMAKEIAAASDFNTVEDAERGKQRLMDALGIDERRATKLIGAAQVLVHNDRVGSPSDRLRAQPYQFPSAESAKEFARAKFDQLEYGVQNYNIGVKNWSAEKMQQQRLDIWQRAYEGALQRNGDDQAAAIAKAESKLKLQIEREYSTLGAHSDLRAGIGGLEAFGPLPANLLTQNADGTLTINRNALKDTVLGNYLNIGSNIGQRIDRAA